MGRAPLHVPRRYGAQPPTAQAANRDELGELRIRYKQPGQQRAEEMRAVIGTRLAATPSGDWQFAAAVAGFGQLLRGGIHTGSWSYGDAAALARQGRGEDPQGWRGEFVQLVELARGLSPQAPGKSD